LRVRPARFSRSFLPNETNLASKGEAAAQQQWLTACDIKDCIGSTPDNICHKFLTPSGCDDIFLKLSATMPSYMSTQQAFSVRDRLPCCFMCDGLRVIVDQSDIESTTGNEPTGACGA